MNENEILDYNHDQNDVRNFDNIRQYTLVLFSLFGIFALFSLVGRFLGLGMPFGIYIPIFRFLLVIVCLIFVYRGKNWAGVILSFIIVWSLVTILFMFVRYISGSAPLFYFIYNSILFILYVLTFRLLNFNKPFQEFYKHQKQKYQKFTSRII